MSAREDSSESTGERATKGAAAGGIGTLLVAIANSFSKESIWHQVFLYAAPWGTVASQWLSGLLYPVCHRRLKKWKRDRAVRDARDRLDKVIEGSNRASPEHRAFLQQQSEELDRIRVSNAMEDVRFLNANPPISNSVQEGSGDGY